MSRIEPEFNISDIKSHEAWLRTLASRILRNKDDVDDVVQDVWLANLHRNETRNPSLAWLSAVTRNLSVTRLRRKTQRLEVERRAAREEELGENVQSAIESVCLYEQILRWILELEEPYRETLLLRFARDLKLREVARLMDVPESTVRVRTSRGLVILRRKARSEFSEERRRHLVLLLFGVRGTRRVLRSALVSAAVMVALTIPFVFRQLLDDEDETSVHLERTAADAPTEVPRIARHSRNIPAASDATVFSAETGTTLEIRGRIALRRGGVLRDGRLEIEAVPFMVGSAMALPAMRPSPPPFAAPYAAAHTTTVENGQPFRIAVTEPGRYRLMITMDGVKGALQFWSGTKHWTDADQVPPSTFDLLEGLEIIHEPTGHGRCELGWRHRDGAERETLHFVSGVARLDGLFMPRLQLRWTDLRNDQVWVRGITDSVTTVRLPELIRSSPFRIRSSDEGEPLRDARLSVVFVPLDNVAWASSAAVPSPQHPELFLPRSTSAARFEVTVLATGFLARVFDLRKSDLPGSIELLPRRAVSGHLILPAGADLNEVTVVAAMDRTPVLAGAVSADGSFILEPVEPADLGERGVEGKALVFWILGDGIYGRAEAVVVDGRVLLRPPRGKTFELVLRDSDMAPVAGAKLIVLPWDEEPVAELMMGERLTADDAGVVDFGSVCGGKWLVDVRAPGFAPQRIVVDWSADPRHIATIFLSPTRDPRCTITVLLPNGDPLPYARIFVEERGKPPLEVRTDGLGNADLSHARAQGVPLEVSYPGHTPSLYSPMFAARDGAETTVVMSPIVEVPCTVISRDAGAVWVRCSPLGEPEGRHRVFRLESGKSLPLTDEEQRLEFLRPGYASQTVDVIDRSAAITIQLPRGPSLSILDCEIGDRVTLHPELEASPAAANADMRSDFVLEKVADASVIEWPAIMPGAYRLELRSPADGASSSRRLVITSNLTVSRHQLH